MSDGGEIVIKGGSVEITFNADEFVKDTNDHKLHRHDGLKMINITVEDESGKELWSSETNEGGLKHRVRIKTRRNGPSKP
jgi:hypothetical protein